MVHDTFQTKMILDGGGYGAFSISKSSESAVIQYIKIRKNTIGKKSFQEEFKEILNKYGIEYNENYIWK